ncbi:hypothetical protein JD844_019552, partial [Phrynosoma platyrhinos]
MEKWDKKPGLEPERDRVARLEAKVSSWTEKAKQSLEQQDPEYYRSKNKYYLERMFESSLLGCPILQERLLSLDAAKQPSSPKGCRCSGRHLYGKQLNLSMHPPRWPFSIQETPGMGKFGGLGNRIDDDDDDDDDDFLPTSPHGDPQEDFTP